LCIARKSPHAAPTFDGFQGGEFIAESAASADPRPLRLPLAAPGAFAPEELRPKN
jgi:hypothetical protein